MRPRDGDPLRLPQVVHDRRLVARPRSARSAGRSTSAQPSGTPFSFVPPPGWSDRCAGRSTSARPIGHPVQIKTPQDIAGKNRFRGTVVAATDQSARIAVGETELDIPYETIVRGNLIDEG